MYIYIRIYIYIGRHPRCYRVGVSRLQKSNIYKLRTEDVEPGFEPGCARYGQTCGDCTTLPTGQGSRSRFPLWEVNSAADTDEYERIGFLPIANQRLPITRLRQTIYAIGKHPLIGSKWVGLYILKIFYNYYIFQYPQYYVYTSLIY